MSAVFRHINLNGVRGFIGAMCATATPPPTTPILFGRYKLTEPAPEQSSLVLEPVEVIENFLPEESSDDDDDDGFVVIPDPKLDTVAKLLIDFDADDADDAD